MSPKDEHAPKAEEKPVVHAAPHWDYKDADTWGDLSPAFAACKTGKQQSPIDITPAKSDASDIVFDYRPTKATVKDNGHTYQVDLAPGSGVNIDDKRYDLLQFHVHTPSEHTIAGEAYALEVHLVHKSADGKLAVIGVLVDRGAANPGLAAAWKKLPKPDKTESVRKPFDPAALLPADRTVFRYEGSLTTPPCGEGVLWNVMRHTVSHAGNDIDVVRARFGDNARPVQAMGARKLL
jgi:carbonic anhydrase